MFLVIWSSTVIAYFFYLHLWDKHLTYVSNFFVCSYELNPLLFTECRDKVVDFHWDTCDPWTIVSVSDDGESTGGGGTLQVIMEFSLLLYINEWL